MTVRVTVLRAFVGAGPVVSVVRAEKGAHDGEAGGEDTNGGFQAGPDEDRAHDPG